MEALLCKNLSFAYPGEKPLLKNVSFCLPEGSATLLMGATGCGKSTLLRLLKSELVPRGKKSGELLLFGKSTAELTDGELASRVGYVCQNPEEQIVCDKVWHELSFAPENLGMASAEIRRRVGETCAFFGISDWFDRDCATLSGGQKQILNLAAATVLCPDILLLDEPTAQLDPVAAEEFLHLLFRLQRERGMTVLLCEHRAEFLLPLCDRALWLSEGSIAYEGEPRGLYDCPLPPELLAHLPAAMRVAIGAKSKKRPLNIREGREMLEKAFVNYKPVPEPETLPTSGEEVLCMSHVGFRYERRESDILSDLNLRLHRGQFYCLYGGNGSGKSTLLTVAAGLRLPAEGSVKILDKKITRRADPALYRGTVAYLPQQVRDLFIYDTVEEELSHCENPPENFPFDFTSLLSHHPYDISGGEAELLGLYKALSTRPQILFLDEPTKGLDGKSEQTVGALLENFCRSGGAVLCVTHDTDFGARRANVCGLLFRGELICEETPGAFFSKNTCFTTAASRMSRGIIPLCVQTEQIVSLLARRETVPEENGK